MHLHRLLLLVATSAALLPLSAPARSSAQSNVGTAITLPFILNNSPSIRPDDSFYQSDQWNLQQLDLPHAWYLTTGSSDVSVAVIDTGVDVQHPELAGRVRTGAAFVSPGGCPEQSPSYDDDDGHGTHVAGIIGAQGNNGAGVAGMAWSTRILPIKVLSCTGGGTIADVVDGIYWAVDNGADVINLSLGWTCSANESLTQSALDYAYQRGVVVVAAAGNYANQSIQGVRNPMICPAALDHVISVGATTINLAAASYSTSNEFVDLAAPGGSSSNRILSSYPEDVLDVLTGNTGSLYSGINGTSQASPHVAGLAALLLARNPSLQPDEVLAVMATTAIDIGASGRDDVYGYGLIAPVAALSTAEDPPLLPSARLQVRPAGVEPGVGSYEPGVILLRWAADAGVDARAVLLAQVNAREDAVRAPSDMVVLRVAEGQEQQVLEALLQSPLVTEAGLNLFVELVG